MQSRELERKSFGKSSKILEVPDLIAIQKESYEWFLQRNIPPEKRKKQGLQELLMDTFPIVDYTGNLVLEFVEYNVGEPKYTQEEAYERGTSYQVPLEITLRLKNKARDEIKEQKIFFGEIPLMTDKGTFIFNGAERVVVSQLIRSSGAYFYENNSSSDMPNYGFKIIPKIGSWLQFDMEGDGVIYVKFDKRRKIPVTILLRALGYSSDEEILSLFPYTDEIQATIKKDPTTSYHEGLLELFRRLRPSEPPNIDSAKQTLHRMLFDPKRYDLGEVGRYKINKKLSIQERIIGLVLSDESLKDNEGNVIAEGGTLITKALAEKIEELRIPKVVVSGPEGDVEVWLELPETLERISDNLIDRKILEDIYDDTGKLIVKSGDIITKEIVRKLKKVKDKVLVEKGKSLTSEDIIGLLRYLLNLKRGVGKVDDIDHLGIRRVKAVGELLQNHLRAGFLKLESSIKEKMSLQQDDSALTPQTLVNVRPITAIVNQFFGSSQLSQFMDHVNPLSALTHKRRLSALGPGGLTREHAGFEVRDVHASHYGRICPVETPEGPNIGLIGTLAVYARINEMGFIETPYRVVKNGKATNEVRYLTAIDEEGLRIAPATLNLDKDGNILDEEVPVRYNGRAIMVSKDEVDMMDVAPNQMVGVSASLIPFLEHDDANRALMGANMQRQAVPLIRPEAPLVGTGMEKMAAKYSGALVISDVSGEVVKVSGDEISVKTKNGDIKTYTLQRFKRTNQGTCFNQKPLVSKGDKIKIGDVLADGPLTDRGDLALGRNLLVAFMPWRGYNFEDAILINERLLKEDILTSIHILEYEVEARDTKLGPEEITRDIPNVGESALRNLDERGIIRVGAKVKEKDILVGKVTPKGETELSAEERLLRAIFGEKARDVKDTSLRVSHGEYGKVIAVKEFSREAGDELPSGVNRLVKVWVAQKRKISVGDKLSGRHGNKGVVSRIVPEEDMPFLEDGTPVDIVLNPLGVPSRMNIGQILETHLGWAVKKLGLHIATPAFDGASEKDIEEYLERAGLPRNGKVYLRDGRTGERFNNPVTVGYIYMLKLIHLVDDKIHARATGPYSLVTQQPLGGKAQFGGQRFGEMEVWALEGYGSAYTLQEMLTVKSDDVIGRVKTYEAIIRGENIPTPGIPESFKVLIKELQSLALKVQIYDEKGNEIQLKEMEEDLGTVSLKASPWKD